MSLAHSSLAYTHSIETLTAWPAFVTSQSHVDHQFNGNHPEGCVMKDTAGGELSHIIQGHARDNV